MDLRCEIVKDSNVVSCSKQCIGGMRSYKSSAPGDKNSFRLQFASFLADLHELRATTTRKSMPCEMHRKCCNSGTFLANFGCMSPKVRCLADQVKENCNRKWPSAGELCPRTRALFSARKVASQPS